MVAEFHTQQFKPYQPKKGEAYMNPKQLEHFRKMLTTLKDELSQDIDRTVHTMQDEATIFADPNDRASQESDMALELRNRDRERKLIKKIEETIAKIDGGRLRLLRQLRRRDRAQAPRGPAHRHAVHRLQDPRRAARAASREVASRPTPALRSPRSSLRYACRCEAGAATHLASVGAPLP